MPTPSLPSLLSNSLRATALAGALLAASFAAAQAPQADVASDSAIPASIAVPRLVKFSGTLRDGRGYPITTPIDVTFALYSQSSGDTHAALWKETQRVSPNDKGAYTVYLGAASSQGLSPDLFTSATAQWLGVQADGEQEQPRVLLVSVPYAFKAGDAQTLGGLPASAFALAGSTNIAPAQTALAESASASRPSLTAKPQLNVSSPVTTTGGSSGFIPQFSGASTIVNSPIAVASGAISIGALLSPASLAVHGAETLYGRLTLPSIAGATSSVGQSSQPLLFQAASYSSISQQSIPQSFTWQAAPTANDTIAPSAALNLLFAAGTATPKPTGLSIAPNGNLTFATGQVFPGAVTGVTAGTGLTGGGTNGGALTLTLDTTKVPLLAANNNFTGASQYFAGGAVFAKSVTVDGTFQALTGITSPYINAISGLEIGGVNFASGSQASGDAFMGYAGNSTNSGYNNTGAGANSLTLATSSNNSAFGSSALAALTSGTGNTAVGASALSSDIAGFYNTAAGYDAALSTTGSENTAFGMEAMAFNTTGSGNTAIGFAAGPTTAAPALSNATAIGAGSTVAQSNSLILGQTTAGSPGNAFVNVGIGTATPVSAMEISVNSPGALGPTLTLTNPGGVTTTQYDYASVDFNTQPLPTSGTYNPGARIEAMDDAHSSDHIVFQSKTPGSKANGIQTNMIIASDGKVIVGGTLQQIEDAQFESLAPAGVLGMVALGGPAGLAGTTALYGQPGIEAIGGAGSSRTAAGGAGAFIYGGAQFGDGIDAIAGTGGNGIVAVAGSSIGQVNPEAGAFTGDVTVSGTLYATVKDFRIDHPQDPANKYLNHTSIESSEMVNIYSGNVVTDDLGVATVTLPDWFESLNTDFRYQLTVIGGRFAQAIVSQEIANHKFVILTNAQHVKVSWQVTGVRHDAYAAAHPLIVEETKNEIVRGSYKHPELYGQPEEKSELWARHPEMMRRAQAVREHAATAAPDARTTEAGAPATAVYRPFTPAAVPANSAHENKPAIATPAPAH